MTKLVCTCCGTSVEDDAKENVWHGETPYPGDEGTGMCRRCGGDPDASAPRERLGFGLCCLVDARIPVLAERLSEANRERFLAMSYEAQANAVLTLMAKGLLS